MFSEFVVESDAVSMCMKVDLSGTAVTGANNARLFDQSSKRVDEGRFITLLNDKNGFTSLMLC